MCAKVRTLPCTSFDDDTVKLPSAPLDSVGTVRIQIPRPRRELQIGHVILERYELLEKLGSGTMGIVFKCRDQISPGEYVLKMIPPKLSNNAIAMEGLRKEFQRISSLNHPNIAAVRILDRDKNGTCFLIMDYAHGESLQQWIKRKWASGQPEFKEVIDIITQIAAALDYAQSQHIPHQGVKPANVILNNTGMVKMINFDLSSTVRNILNSAPSNQIDSSETQAPPSSEFKNVCLFSAADQYALGVMAYQMLAGDLPFDSDETPDPIVGISDFANASLQRVLNKDAKQFFESCSAFVKSLSDSSTTFTGQKAEQTETSPVTPSPKQNGKKSRKWGCVWGAVILSFGIAYFVNCKIEEQREAAEVLRKAEEQRKAEELRKAAEEKRKAEALRKAEEQRKAEELRKAAEEKRKAEALRKAEEQRKAEELRKAAEEKRKAEALRKAEEQHSAFISQNYILELPGGIRLEMVGVKAGTFEMSARDGENSNDEISHSVKLEHDFFIGKTEVTQAQWKAVMGNNPSNWKGDDLPVENVSWNDAMKYCEKLNELGKAPKGWKFALPTETQWEYAARGGSRTKGYKYSGSSNIDDVAWYKLDKTHPVAQKHPNEL